jgi:hypothetical protein
VRKIKAKPNAPEAKPMAKPSHASALTLALQGAPISRQERLKAKTVQFRERLFAKLNRYIQQTQQAATEKDKAAFSIAINRVLRKIAEVSQSHLFDGPGGKPTPAVRSKSSRKVGPGVRAR